MTRSATQNPIWSHIQRGLVYPSPHAIYAIFFRGGRKPLTKKILRDLMRELRDHIHDKLKDAHTSAVTGVGFPLWREWSGKDVPNAIDFLLPDPANPATSEVFARSNGTIVDSAGDLWFHIKSDKADHCVRVLEYIRKRLEVEEKCVDPQRTLFQAAARKTGASGEDGGKVVGCRFSENLNNATDPLSLEEHVLIDDDTEHRGASIVFTQRFRLNWDHILNMTPEQIEDLVGRTTSDVLIPSRDTRSHIKCARVQNDAGDTVQILRLSLPFGQSPAIHNSDLLQKGASIRDEDGIFFAAYANSVQTFERILDNQIGPETGLMRDRVLSEVRSDLGGFFYVPSQEELG
ncbi:MAG TPA: Dyp-type peroxidase, partial [Thermoanaerobaculia bacterium]